LECLEKKGKLHVKARLRCAVEAPEAENDPNLLGAYLVDCVEKKEPDDEDDQNPLNFKPFGRTGRSLVPFVLLPHGYLLPERALRRIDFDKGYGAYEVSPSKVTLTRKGPSIKERGKKGVERAKGGSRRREGPEGIPRVV
jgi:hypothetical protein